MKRRKFLKLSIATTALAALAPGAESAGANQKRTSAGFRVGARKARLEEELLIMGGRFDLKVSSRDTGGELCIYDTYRDAKGGPALHVHYFQDEWFYVIRGEFIFRVGEDTFRLNPGDSAFGPRKVPHAFAKVGDGPGQMLIAWQPAGSMEDFFYQMSKMGKDIPGNQEVVYKKLWESHGMEVVGPPLKV
jgi:mannose-6-phosphate isomerase-like protein (cupin superfamily)